MEKKDFLPFCRYYKGEKECPKGMAMSFWNYERAWVDLSVDKEDNALGNMLDEYIAYGLGEFEQMDNTPVTLKALLFNRYSHWMGCNTDGFKKWYKKEYHG